MDYDESKPIIYELEIFDPSDPLSDEPDEPSISFRSDTPFPTISVGDRLDSTCWGDDRHSILVTVHGILAN
jgi:hypothetical protein